MIRVLFIFLALLATLGPAKALPVQPFSPPVAIGQPADSLSFSSPENPQNPLQNKEFLRPTYLNPDAGRFWTRDKYEGTKYDPASLHRYLYTQANPVNAIDPSGEFSLAEIMAEIGIDEEMQATVNAFAEKVGQQALKKVGCNLAEAAAVQGVYVLVLGDGSLYVGQTGRMVAIRFQEHLRKLEMEGARIVGMLKITTGIENVSAAKYLREIFEALLIRELNPSKNTVKNPVAGSNRLGKYADPVKAGMDKLFELTPLCHGTTH